ncbi:hypothetical protein G6F65_022609 [Rhizopus arrhizus]|nr:hypothetical protein G6F65_022609 [Rhizopus arrhizus]
MAGQFGRPQHDQRAIAQGVAQAIQVDVLRAPVRSQVGQVVALVGSGRSRGRHRRDDAAEQVIRAAVRPERQCHGGRGGRDVGPQLRITKYGQRHSRQACGPTGGARRSREPECCNRTRTRRPALCPPQPVNQPVQWQSTAYRG